MEAVYSWFRNGKSSFHAVDSAWSNLLIKGDNKLIISETKGCHRIVEGLITAVKRNLNAGPGRTDDFIDRIIIFTDNDEADTANHMLTELKNNLQDMSVTFNSDFRKNVWNSISILGIEGVKSFELYVMFIPFDENGALETYLLKCIGNKDSYDQEIINKDINFVETIDPDKRYLTQRRLKTKAKFDVYFSVRTSAEQYSERQNILKSIAWENYDTIRNDFKIFEELG